MRWIALTAFLAACESDGDGGDADGGDTDTDLPWITDSIAQTTLERVDIVWLVDPEWDEGVDALSDVATAGTEVLLIADTDWKQGTLNVTGGTASKDWGKFHSVWSSYPGPNNAFKVLPPGQPLTDARHRDALYTALELKATIPQNEDFIRSDAHLYVIVLGDRVDQSTDTPISYADFLTWLEGLTSDSKRLGAIVGEDSVLDYFTSVSEDVGGGGFLYQVGSFTQAVQGQMRTAIQQRDAFPLSEIPSEPPRSVTVDVRNEETTYKIDDDYRYDAENNAIVFHEYVPPPGAHVIVRYLPVGIETPPPLTETADTGGDTGTAE
jgi:hypothetical protein